MLVRSYTGEKEAYNIRDIFSSRSIKTNFILRRKWKLIIHYTRVAMENELTKKKKKINKWFIVQFTLNQISSIKKSNLNIY